MSNPTKFEMAIDHTQREPVQARFKEIGPKGKMADRLSALGPAYQFRELRVLCGHAACPGLLGSTRVSPSPLDSPNLTHPRRLRLGSDGAYRVLNGSRKADNGQPIGRRPIPPSIRPAALFRGRRALGLPPLETHGVYGQYPTLPAIVMCPVCGTRNKVPKPGPVE